MRPERETTITKVISEFWQLDEGSRIPHDISVLTNVFRTGWKFVGFLPSFQEYPPAVLKVYFQGDGFDHEVKGISAANSFPPIGNVTTPKVLRIIPEYKAIITEYIKMHDSRSALRWIHVGNQSVNWKDLGSWLRSFHDSETTNQQNKTFIEHKIQKSYDQIEKFATRFSDNHVKQINSLISAAHEDLSHNLIEWVISHGDFHTGNLKISGNSTYIIDFENTTITPRGYEVIHFQSCIEATIYFMFRKQMFCLLSKEFLDGYGIVFPLNTLNNYFCLLGKLDTISYYHKRKNKTKNIFTKIMFYLLEHQTIKALAKWVDLILKDQPEH
ncbi:MAG: aminoglycoside phosphotransferase family protein [Anaerolineaceae bacterium]|nr:aminoglycoside phosphotransferase family protein [Anaerolineaceae bacterium]